MGVVKIFALIGFTIVGIGGYMAWSTSARVKTVASWPTVMGYVAESAIRWGAEASKQNRKSHQYAYLLETRTEYRIDGQPFSSTTPGIKEIRDTKIFNTDPWKNQPEKEMIYLFQQIPQGIIVPVHYNPENKAEAYIFSRLPFWYLYSAPFYIICTGVIFLLLPLRAVSISP